MHRTKQTSSIAALTFAELHAAYSVIDGTQNCVQHQATLRGKRLAGNATGIGPPST